MWLLNKMLSKLIRKGQLVVTDHDGKVYTYGPGANGTGGTDPVIRIRLTDKGAANHIARYPRVGAGEAYMDGRLVVEAPHDIRDLVLFAASNGQQGSENSFEPATPLRRLADKIGYRLDSVIDKATARKNAEHTYNLSRPLYELFLDEDRQYTMAYWQKPDISLEEAQVDKKALIAAKLYLQPGQTAGKRVLDIGCGWGGMALYLARQYPDIEVHGIALAPDQIAFCKERAEAEGLSDRVKFDLMDYRDTTGPYDRILSVGMLEHVGAPQFPKFFEHNYKVLKNDGVLFTHLIGRVGGPGITDAWTRKYIFPGGYIPALSELQTVGEKCGWETTDVETLRYHYALTLHEWYKRTTMHHDEIVALYDERFFRMWQFYLVGAEQAFRHGGLVNYQIQMVKSRDALPITRDYIAAEAARLRAADTVPGWRFDPMLKEAAE